MTSTTRTTSRLARVTHVRVILPAGYAGNWIDPDDPRDPDRFDTLLWRMIPAQIRRLCRGAAVDIDVGDSDQGHVEIRTADGDRTTSQWLDADARQSPDPEDRRLGELVEAVADAHDLACQALCRMTDEAEAEEPVVSAGST